MDNSFAILQATLEALKTFPLPLASMVVKHTKYRYPGKIQQKLLLNCHWAHTGVQNGREGTWSGNIGGLKKAFPLPLASIVVKNTKYHYPGEKCC